MLLLHARLLCQHILQLVYGGWYTTQVKGSLFKSILNLGELLNLSKAWTEIKKLSEKKNEAPCVVILWQKPNISGNFQYITKPHKKLKQLAHINAFVNRIRTQSVYKCMLNMTWACDVTCVGMTTCGSVLHIQITTNCVCICLLPISNTNTIIHDHSSFNLHHNFLFTP